MAKKQSFADKSKKTSGKRKVNVKVIKSVKTDKGYKFNENWVELDHMSEINKLENQI